MDPRLNGFLPIIFELLPQEDKFVFGQVCKQWRDISFHYTKKLDFAESPFNKIVNITDAKLEYFLENYRDLTSLCNLHIYEGFSTSTDPFAIIAQKCGRIEEIDIHSEVYLEGSLALLANRCPELRSFSAGFVGSDKCDEDGFVLLVKHLKLERLSVLGFRGLSTWLTHIHSPLRSLNLLGIEFDAGDLIEGLKNVTCTLRELEFDGCNIKTESELQTVMDLCPGVVSLSVTDYLGELNQTYGDWLLRAIPRWARLEELTVEAPVSDRFIESLVGGCPKLRKLSISLNDDLTETGLSQLGRMKELTHLTLDSFETGARCITDGVLIALKNPKLKELSVGIHNTEDRGFVTDHGCIEVLANCPRLELLNIENRCVTTQTVLAARSSLLADQNRPKLTINAHGTDVVWEPWFHDSVLKVIVHTRGCLECDEDEDEE